MQRNIQRFFAAFADFVCNVRHLFDSKVDRILENDVEIIYHEEKPGTDVPPSKGRIYVTGKIEGMTKSEVKAYVESKGYEWSASISSKLSLLVIGIKAGGSKVAKAKKLGIKIVNWDEFISNS